MRVLVTRPLNDARRTAQKLSERGHEALIAPLLEIRIAADAKVSLDGVQAILATSANGICALAKLNPQRDVPVFAVGARTALTARSEGYREVLDAAGHAKSLSTLVTNRLRANAGDLLHAAGSNAQLELQTALRGAGFHIRSPVLYEAAERRTLPPEADEALRSGSLDAVLTFSPRSAAAFANCVQNARLRSACRRLIACCISQEAAEPLRQMDFASIRIAAHPDHETLLALLDEDTAHGEDRR
ncbi:MAG TPA: uroporphyrinogen-III synthase [Rhizomicrobium sp.]|jgi:uroporphyrinogen-III synthase